MATSDRPVIVVGCARSGTTLLQLMLQAHSRLAMPPENRFVMPIYERRVEFGDPSDPATRDAVADFIIDRPRSKFADLGVDPDVARARIHEAPPTIGSFIGAVLEQYAQRFDRPRWGDKRPNYIQHLDRVLALFPDAQILHIIRDGRDCVASLKRMPWWRYGVPAAIYKWRAAMRTADWAKDHLRADQYHEFHYEDLVANPQPVLERICAFLEEDFEPAMLEPHKVADDEVPDYKGWHARTRQPVTASTVRSWEQGLEPGEVRLMEHVAGHELRAYGYELSRNWLRRRPTPAERTAWDDYVERRTAKEQQAAKREAARQADYGWPVAARLTSEQRRLAEQPVGARADADPRG